MNSYPAYSYQSAGYPGNHQSYESDYAIHEPVASGLACSGSSHSHSDYPQDAYTYYNESQEFPDPEESFVSPVTYDPTSGLYIQTFPPEHEEFLRKYGQHIEIPDNDEDSQRFGWTYHEACNPNEQIQRPTGFHYNYNADYHAAASQAEVAMSSPVSEHDATFMLQYIASPTPAPNQVHNPQAERTISPAALYGAENYQPQGYYSQAPYVTVTPVYKFEEDTAVAIVHELKDELAQPHMIVPSQRALGNFMEEVRRREAGVETAQPYQPSKQRWMNHLPHQDPALMSPANVAPSQLLQPYQETSDPRQQGQGQSPATDYPAHDAHPPTPEDPISPTTSCDTDDTHYSQGKMHSHSPVARPRSLSRGWSPPRRSISPRSASIRLSPLPPSKRVPVPAEKKPTLACLFCRGRKIACGPPLPGSPDKTCNQCARRHLKCEYPTESRRGMRRRRISTGSRTKVSRKRTIR